jgi:hypothetical protein
MTADEILPVGWQKSSYSGSTGGECVEVARLADGKAVRDSKNPAGGFLNLQPTTWATLVSEIKQGTYDFDEAR